MPQGERREPGRRKEKKKITVTTPRAEGPDTWVKPPPGQDPLPRSRQPHVDQR